MAGRIRRVSAGARRPRRRGRSPLAGFAARLPLSMTGLGIVLLISLTTGSFGRAGLVTAVRHAHRRRRRAGVGPADRPDRPGPGADRRRRSSTAVEHRRADHHRAARLPRSRLTCSPRSACGLGFYLRRCRRARPLELPAAAATPLLNTAFAWEAVLDEVVFIVGPVLVTFLATTIHPALGLAAGGRARAGRCLRARGPAGHRAAAGQPGANGRAATSKLSLGLLVPIVFACAALGVLFGGMEVVVVAFAREHDVLPYSGVILMVWASGSLIAGRGHRHHPLEGRHRRSGSGSVRCCWRASLLPLPFVDHPCCRRRPADAERARHRADADRLGRGHPGRPCRRSGSPRRSAGPHGHGRTGVALGAAALGRVIDTAGAPAAASRRGRGGAAADRRRRCWSGARGADRPAASRRRRGPGPTSPSASEPRRYSRRRSADPIEAETPSR